jgi:hypothetical protein
MIADALGATLERLMGNVGVSEHHLVDRMAAHQRGECVLVQHRNPIRVPRAGERRGVPATCDAWDLRRGERHDLDIRVLAVDDVEVVKVEL